MNNRKDTTRRDDITNVRALAIFLVVLGHSIILYSSAWGGTVKILSQIDLAVSGPVLF